MIGEGDRAPDFTVAGIDGDGNEVSTTLSELSGTVVLYFYPKDDTSGCTTQACGIRDEWSAFRAAKATVIGVSPDDLDSHRTFSEKYDLPFTLLSDTDHEVAEAYGVWRKKKMFGNEFWGIERSTFIIEDGVIRKAFRRVDAKKHADRVLGVLD